jgi:hypothetical protein
VTPQLVHHIETAIALVEREAALRQAGRVAELVPGRRMEAERAFRVASGLRKMRLELLERCGLTR